MKGKDTFLSVVFRGHAPKNHILSHRSKITWVARSGNRPQQIAKGCVSNELNNESWGEFMGLTADVRAGLVPAPCGATTRVARTPRNPKELIFFLSTEMKHTHC